MTQDNQSIKGLVIYASVIPLAIFLGYVLTSPQRHANIALLAVVFLVLITPLILRWHHPLLLLSWNMTAVAPLPGRPQLWLVLAFVSLTICLMQYALLRNVRFVKNRSILYPLLFIGAVVLVTAQLTGGIGLRVAGSENIGGRKYILMLGAIVGYLAIAAHPIPRQRALLFVGLFLLGGMTAGIGNLVPFVPPALYPIFIVFPVETQGIMAVIGQDSVVAGASVTRLFGLSVGLMAVAYFLVARYGLNRLLNPRKPAFWVFLFGLVASTFGGFRSFLILSLMTVTIVFFLEGLHRSPKVPLLLLTFVLMGAGVAGFSDRLPVSVQRSLAFLPLRLDPVAKLSAEATSEWRLEMWKGLMPEIPRYFLLGKGLSISEDDLDLATNLANQGRGKTADVALLAGDYHSGPLSVIIPFGIWGVIGWVWFVVAGTRALYFNYRYSPPELKTINTFLFAYFIAKMVLFHLIFGAFESELMIFTGILGLSVALNGGILKPAPEVTKATSLHGPLARPRLIPGFSRLEQK